MTKEALIQKLSSLEWEDFEVKKAQSEVPKSLWETVSSFSNTSGGWIVLGVSEKEKRFEITGVQNAEKLEQDFLNTSDGAAQIKELRKQRLTACYEIAHLEPKHRNWHPVPAIRMPICAIPIEWTNKKMCGNIPNPTTRLHWIR